MEVYEIFLAGGAGKTAEGLLREHGLFFIIVTALAHEKVVQVLQLAFEQLQGLLSFGLVCELLGQGSDDVVQTVHHGLLKFFEVAAVCLLVEFVLNLLDPL
jgi:hypothetical protein